jgi:hypothetical protein
MGMGTADAGNDDTSFALGRWFGFLVDTDLRVHGMAKGT